MQLRNTFNPEELLRALPGTAFLLRARGAELDAVMVGDGLHELVGLPSGALMAKGWLRDRVHPDDAHLLLPDYPALAGKGEVTRLFRIRLPEGEYRWIHQRCRLFQPGSPQDYLIAGLLADGREQQALREAARRYEGFVRLSSDWYWEQDEHFRFTYFSSEFQEITGISSADVFGMTRWESLGRGAESEGVDWDSHRETLSAHRPFRNFEYSSRIRPGRIIWFRTSGQPKFDEEGRFTGYFGVASDITGYKRIEQELRHTIAEQLAILDNASLGILFTRFHVFRRCNRRAAELFGYDEHELIGQVAMVVHVSPESYGNFLAEAVPPLRSGRSFETDIEFKRKSGELFWCHVYGKAVDPQRTEEGTIWLIEDITERRRNEQALRQTLMEMEAVMSNASVGILFTKDRRLTRYNRRFAEMFGFRADEGLGMPARVLYPSREAYDSLGPFQAELEMRRQDGSIFWAQLIGYVLNPADTKQGTVWIIEDRTEHKRTEQSLINALHLEKENQRVQAELYRREVEVAEARATIAARARVEEELRAAKSLAERAQAAAEEASRTKDHFLAMLSHELRTPLAPVLGAVTLLRKELPAEGRAHEHLELIRRNVELQSRLIDDLLDITRIVRGMVELDRREVDLFTIVERAVEVCRSELDTREIDLRLDCPAQRYTVLADAARLQQVFWNLLSNACKFTPPRGRVTVSCRPEPGHAVVEVSDSGIGVEPGQMARIFDAFAQAELSITRRFGGLGLGLAISKALVEMHGGTITAHSEGLNRGATFSVRLPVVPSSKDSEPPVLLMSANAAAAGALRILLVEDHVDTAETMVSLLELVGHSVGWAADVKTAVDMAVQGDFHLLISDIGLPDGTGHALLRQLRLRGLPLPAIALSGFGQDEDIEQSLSAGFRIHLVKPIDLERLIEAIDGVTGEKRA